MQTSNNKYNWYAVYVKYQHEKKLHQYLTENNIVSYLPLENKLHHRSDRNKYVKTPLFPCYIFVHVSNKEYFRVLQHPSAVRYISFSGNPVIISNKQIRSIQSIINSKLKFTLHCSNFLTGDKIKIEKGPLKGCTGEIIKNTGKERLIINIYDIGYSLMVHIPSEQLTIIKKT